MEKGPYTTVNRSLTLLGLLFLPLMFSQVGGYSPYYLLIFESTLFINMLFMNNKTSFATLMLSYQKVYDLPALFEDFLNLCLCVLSPNAIAGLPWDRGRFEQLLKKYSDPSYPLDFVQVFNCLLRETPKHRHPDCFNDVLGAFYKEYILSYDPEEPFSLSNFDEHTLSSLTLVTLAPRDGDYRKKGKLLDELCGSGRQLLSRRWMHTIDGFYGLEIRPVCAKMAILNLFLNRVPNGEIVCKKTEDYSYSFLFGYRFSERSLGIEEIMRQEDSVVWQIMRNRTAIAA
jgi:hypothetical protein